MAYKLQGYSIVELVIVIVVLAIISALLSFFLLQGFSSYFEGEQVVQNQGAGALAMSMMSNDVRQVRDPTAVTAASSSQFAFTKFNGSTVTYSLSNGQLIRNEGSSPSVLASNVQAFPFQYYDATGALTSTLANIRYVDIDLVISESGGLSRFSTTVYPRYIQ